MISIGLFIYILALHYLGDFILQPYSMSIKKSESPLMMFYHVWIYSLTLYVGLLFFVDVEYALKFAGLNFIFHYIVDYLTSRVISENSSNLLLDPDVKKPIHKRLKLWGPISLLGFDQLLHQASLLIACYILS